MDENDNGDYANPADLTGKYNSEIKKKGKVGRCRYRGDDKVEALHGLYEEPNDDDGDYDDDWDDMEEKERENKDDNVIDVTAAQFFGTPDYAFIIKKNEKTGDKKGDDGDKNNGGSADSLKRNGQNTE